MIWMSSFLLVFYSLGDFHPLKSMLLYILVIIIKFCMFFILGRFKSKLSQP